MRAQIIGLGLAGVLLAIPCPALSEQWNWFRASPEGTTSEPWWLLDGKAEVDRMHGRFRAVLHDSADYSSVRQTLHGTISGGRVRARVTTLGSDARDYDVSGTLSRHCRPYDQISGSGEEVLILTNGREAIGLVRTLWDRSCKPTP